MNVSVASLGRWIGSASSGVAPIAVSGVLFEYSSSCELSERSAVRSPSSAYATEVVDTVVPRAGVAPVIVTSSTSRPEAGSVCRRSRIDQRDAHHRERAIVERRLAVGELIVGGERIAVEVRERGLRAADVGVARVGERVELGVAHREPDQIEQVAVRRSKRVGRLRKAARVVGLGHRDLAGEPAQRRPVVVGERGLQAREAAEVLPSVGRQVA